MHYETKPHLQASSIGRSSKRALSPNFLDEYAMTRSEVLRVRAEIGHRRLAGRWTGDDGGALC